MCIRDRVYSTCTWAPEENEEIVSWLLENYDLELETIEKINGMAEGIDYPVYDDFVRGRGECRPAGHGLQKTGARGGRLVSSNNNFLNPSIHSSVKQPRRFNI